MCTYTDTHTNRYYYYYLYLNYIIRHGPLHKNTFHIWNLNFSKEIDVTTRDQKCATKCIILGLLSSCVLYKNFQLLFAYVQVHIPKRKRWYKEVIFYYNTRDF